MESSSFSAPPFLVSVSNFDSCGHDYEAICNGRLWSDWRAEEVEGNSYSI